MPALQEAEYALDTERIAKEYTNARKAREEEYMKLQKEYMKLHDMQQKKEKASAKQVRSARGALRLLSRTAPSDRWWRYLCSRCRCVSLRSSVCSLRRASRSCGKGWRRKTMRWKRPTTV